MKKLFLLMFLLVVFCEIQVSPKPSIKITKKIVVSLSFDEAFKQIDKYEGGYGNDPNDVGEETYCGISRLSHPGWSGWKYIDSQKPIRYNKKFAELDDKVYNFYETLYWKRLKLDSIYNQALAEEMFDISVNMGYGNAVIMLKKSINVLNVGRYRNVDINKELDEETLKILQDHSDNHSYMSSLTKLVNGFQLERYKSICEKNPSKRRYLKAWLKRC
jgi:lysozyme family protein